MKNPIINVGSLGSGVEIKSGAIQLVNARGFSATARLKFPTSGGATATLRAYYSPDGNNYDTIEFLTGSGVDVTLSAGNNVQITALIDVPPHGWIVLSLKGGSSTTDATDGKIWYSIDSYSRSGRVTHGNPETGAE